MPSPVTRPLNVSRLDGVHPELRAVVIRAHKLQSTEHLSFVVLEGVRTAAQQAHYVKTGASRVKVSRHQSGNAVDLGVTIDGQVSWHWPLYDRLAVVVGQAAELEHVAIRWGGTWKLLPAIRPLSRTFPDGGHFEIPAAHP